MLIGYVSDERYTALADVLLEFTNGRRIVGGAVCASGAIHCELPPANTTVTLHKPGFGSKRVRMTPRPGQPYHFRLAVRWPARLRLAQVRALRRDRPSSASIRSSRTSWSCGATAGTRSSSAAWAGTTSTARAPSCRSRPTAITRRPASSGTRSATAARITSNTSRRRRSPGCTISTPAPPRDGRSPSPGSSRRPAPQAPVAVLASNITWNAYNNFGGRSNYIHADAFPPTPTVNARQELKRYTDADAHDLGRDVVRAAVVRPARADQPHRPSRGDHRSRSRAGRPATSPPRNGGCSAGWSAKASPTISTPKRSCTTGVLDLAAYRVLILSTHPEYWTREMYDTASRRGSSRQAAG